MENNLVIRTPLLPFYGDVASQRCVYVKPENLQVFGSYKIRGILQVIEEADPIILSQGVSAASAGNMAQSLAYVAKQFQIPCQIFIPDSAPEVKKEKIVQLGGKLVELPYQEVWRMVRENKAPSDAAGLFVHPALNTALLKGYGTIAHEIIEDKPNIDALVIPFGVGGLCLGVSRAVLALKPDVAIYACEPETAAPLKKSFTVGAAASVERIPSFVDAIGTPEVLPEVYEYIRPLLKDSLVMSLSEIKNAMKILLLHNKLLCEGAAACSAAGALRLASTGQYKNIVCILSGGNVSADILKMLSV